MKINSLILVMSHCNSLGCRVEQILEVGAWVSGAVIHETKRSAAAAAAAVAATTSGKPRNQPPELRPPRLRVLLLLLVLLLPQPEGTAAARGEPLSEKSPM